jgi:ATP-binding cassette, subfamily B, bacterial CvaB/MchF/RaxB
MIGAVMQDDRLFAGSLADNICFFDSAPDQVYLEHCARLAHIHFDIVKMPMGYNTLVGDMGTTLSGGQKQRIFLARALYKRPNIIFLDEATSHLDTALEKDITAAVSSLQLTRIVIAHRPETIAASGRVINFQKFEAVAEISA